MEWLCYEYCSIDKCNSVYYYLYSKCRLMDAEGTIYETKITNYGCIC